MLVQFGIYLGLAAIVAFLIGSVRKENLRRTLLTLWVFTPAAVLTVATTAELGIQWLPMSAFSALVFLAPWTVGVLIGYALSRERQHSS